MKRILIYTFVALFAFLFFWRSLPIYGQRHEITPENRDVFNAIYNFSEMGKKMSDLVGPLTGTIEVLRPLRMFPESRRWTEFEVIAQGSCGFITDRHCLTNYHVIQKAWENRGIPLYDFRVRLAYSPTEKGEIKYYDIEIVSVNPKVDCAVLKVVDREVNFPLRALSKTQCLKLGNSDDLHTGQLLFIVSSPLGLKYTSGWLIVSNTAPTIYGDALKSDDVVQVSGPINEGMSGGIVVAVVASDQNYEIRLMGLLRASYKFDRPGDKEAAEPDQDVSSEGIGFVIPINRIKPYIYSAIFNFGNELK